MMRKSRRKFLLRAAGLALAAAGSSIAQRKARATVPTSKGKAASASLRLFLAGDVMTGRGIDQILQHPSNPELFERSAKSAVTYVNLAEQINGALPRKVDWNYIWGDALGILDQHRLDARLVNLETAVTTSDSRWIGKSIHYRMHPANVGCLTAARLSCCNLANNHILDWAYVGLRETLETLRAAGIRTTGAGADMTAAQAPAVLDTASGHRILIFGFAGRSSGVPAGWEAHRWGGGIQGFDESDPVTIEKAAASIAKFKRPGDVVIASIHWGGNWGYAVDEDRRRAAHALIDEVGVALVHGHSSHHPQPIEVYKNKLILYGCGDLINDYEGIRGHGAFRPELGFLYLPEIDAASGELRRLLLTPTRVRRFQVTRASLEEAAWLAAQLTREGAALGTRFRKLADGDYELQLA